MGVRALPLKMLLSIKNMGHEFLLVNNIGKVRLTHTQIYPNVALTLISGYRQGATKAANTINLK